MWKRRKGYRKRNLAIAHLWPLCLGETVCHDRLVTEHPLAVFLSETLGGNGLAFGFISYVALKTLTGRWRDVHPLTWIIALLFLVRFAWLTGH